MSSIIHKIKKLKFKKFYFFDIAIVLVLLMIISFFLYNRFTKKSIWIDVSISLEDPELWWGGESPKYWFVNDFEDDMVSYNSYGDKVAEVEDYEVFSIGGTRKKANIDLKLKVTYDKKRNIYFYNFQPLLKGKSIDLIFGSTNISGLITTINSKPQQRVMKKVKVRVSYLEPWLASLYTVGKEMTDSKGRMLARIDSVITEKSQISRVKFVQGEIYHSNRSYVDNIMEVSLLAFEDSGGYYRFVNGAEIKLGTTVWFQFSDLVVESEILEIIE